MTYKLIGYERFLSKKGTSITKLHCAYKNPTADRLVGTGVESFMILTDNVPSDIVIDSYIQVFYGRQGASGFLASIQVVDNK